MPIAKTIYQNAAKNNKEFRLWVVQKSFSGVDANVDQAVDGIIGAAYGSAGEKMHGNICCCGNGDVAIN